MLCHVHAFAAFGGVPARVVIDNLKAAILDACVHDPLVQRAYRECAAHYGFLIDPQPPRTPRLKGTVEQGGVHYITRNFLAGRAADEPLLGSADMQSLADLGSGFEYIRNMKVLPFSLRAMMQLFDSLGDEPAARQARERLAAVEGR